MHKLTKTKLELAVQADRPVPVHHWASMAEDQAGEIAPTGQGAFGPTLTGRPIKHAVIEYTFLIPKPAISE
jgi:hypothetical protein